MPYLPCVQRGCQKPGEESKWRSIVFRTPRSVVFFDDVGRDSWDRAERRLGKKRRSEGVSIRGRLGVRSV